MLKWGRYDFFGGAGVGKTVLMQELIHNIAKETLMSISICWSRWKNKKVMICSWDEWFSWVIGQDCHGIWTNEREMPGPRARVALTGLTMAEYFRDEEHKDVLLFIDNIFEFTQAGAEISALMGRIPSAVGYQPTLSTEMGIFKKELHQQSMVLLHQYNSICSSWWLDWSSSCK